MILSINIYLAAVVSPTNLQITIDLPRGWARCHLFSSLISLIAIREPTSWRTY